MNEQFKIREAEYHLGRFRETEGREEFAFELSAFLSAARSALQYALEEARQKPGGQAWYDGEVTADPSVRFFKEVRDGNIHVAPVAPAMQADIALGHAVLSLSGTVSIVHIKASGEQVAVPPPLQVQQVVVPASDPLRGAAIPVRYTYRFPAWPGAEDVKTLCGRYLKELKRIVASGRTQGFLTP